MFYDALILCGGRGKRIQSVVKDRPKAMMEINGRAFLDILLKHIAGFGFRRVILCIGYKGDFIKKYYSVRKNRLEIVFSEEKGPLGTAGAVKNAGNFIESKTFLVFNGDSFCGVDLKSFLKFHIAKHALCSIVLAHQENIKDYGAVSVNKSGEVIAFNEKTDSKKAGYVNAGVYIMDKDVLSLIPEGEEFSLEEQVFPGILKKSFYGYLTESPFIDIGVPSRYKLASETLR